MKASPTSPTDKETLFSAINTFRIGKTEQSFRRDIPPDYENKYIKLSRIDSANKKADNRLYKENNGALFMNRNPHLLPCTAGKHFVIIMVMI